MWDGNRVGPHKAKSDPNLIEKGPLGPLFRENLASWGPLMHPFCARGAFLLAFYSRGAYFEAF